METTRVLLVCFLILAFLGIGASMEPILTQFMPSNTKRSGNTAFLVCRVNVTSFGSAYIHWYRQKPGGRLERILYLSSNDNVIHEDGVSEERYEAKKRESDLSASLRIHQVTEADAGLYYCACWDGTVSQTHRDTEQELSHCIFVHLGNPQCLPQVPHLDTTNGGGCVLAQEVLLLSLLCSMLGRGVSDLALGLLVQL